MPATTPTTTPATPEAVQSINIVKEVAIAASPEIVYDSILAQLGPGSEMPDGKPFPMKFEAWPGGRWYRDLGNQTGHLWGHVQVIKPPTLIEISGPLFMSYPAISHVQYRIAAEGKGSRLTLTHRAMGFIPEDHQKGVHSGWEYGVQKIRRDAENRAKSR